MVVPVQNVNYNIQANISATEKWQYDKQLIEFVCQQKELHNMVDRNEADKAHKLCKMREAIK